MFQWKQVHSIHVRNMIVLFLGLGPNQPRGQQMRLAADTPIHIIISSKTANPSSYRELEFIALEKLDVRIPELGKFENLLDLLVAYAQDIRWDDNSRRKEIGLEPREDLYAKVLLTFLPNPQNFVEFTSVAYTLGLNDSPHDPTTDRSNRPSNICVPDGLTEEHVQQMFQAHVSDLRREKKILT